MGKSSLRRPGFKKVNGINGEFKGSLKSFKESRPRMPRNVPKKSFVVSGCIEQQFFIPGRMAGLNDVLEAAGMTYRQTRAIKANAYNSLKRKTERTIELQIRLSKLQTMNRAFFFFTYQEPARNRDKDNIAAVVRKFVFDSLVHEGILPNDGWNQIANWYDHFTVKKSDPGVLVHMLCPSQRRAHIMLYINNFLEKDLQE